MARRNDDNRCLRTFGGVNSNVIPGRRSFTRITKKFTRPCRAALTQPLPRRTALVHALLTYRQPLDLQPQLLAPSAGKRPTQN